MAEIKRINYINDYLKEKYGERTLKICIDGGFTCPNRDGTKSTKGCIFCSERGSGDHLSSVLSITEQINKYFSSYKIERANKFIIYFQNYTNTYDTIENLKSKYDEAIAAFKYFSNEYKLNHEDKNIKELVALQIATRPDCINDEIAKLLSKYSTKLDVAVELGLQTSNDETGEFINRQYSTQDFINAIQILNTYNLDVVAHIMVGLPTKNDKETNKNIEDTVKFINSIDIKGLKIHSTYIVKNTVLESLYTDNKYTPISLEFYLEMLSYILTHISPQLVIHRISGDAPKDLLVASEWNLHKKWVLNGIYKKFKEENLYQGKYFS